MDRDGAERLSHASILTWTWLALEFGGTVVHSPHLRYWFSRRLLSVNEQHNHPIDEKAKRTDSGPQLWLPLDVPCAHQSTDTHSVHPESPPNGQMSRLTSRVEARSWSLYLPQLSLLAFNRIFVIVATRTLSFTLALVLPSSSQIGCAVNWTR